MVNETRIRERITTAVAVERARPGSTRNSEAKVIAGIRAAEISVTITDLGLDTEVVRNDLTIRFQDSPKFILDRQQNVIGIDALVRVFVGNTEQQVDPHRVCINPPTSVPSNTFHDVVDSISGRTIRINHFQEDAREAYFEWLEHSIRTIPNPAGWNTRGTVTTVYASTADGDITSSNNTYSVARSGSALAASSASNPEYIGSQGLSGATSYCFEGFHSFDTSVLPDTDDVTAVAYSVYVNGDGSGVDYTVNARLSNWGATLTTADWVAGASLGALPLLASLATSGITDLAYNTFTENGTAFRTSINKTGITYVLTSSSRHEASTAPTGFDEWVNIDPADFGGTTHDPKLDITHNAVATDATVTVVLKQGASTIATWTDQVLDNSAIADLNLPITEAELATISYPATDLTLEITGTLTGTGFDARIYEIELTAPYRSTFKLNLQINLVGRSSTLTIGSLTVLLEQNIVLTGRASTLTIGTLKLNEQINLTGRASTLTIGSVSVKQQINLAGVPSTLSVGTLTVLAEQNIVLTGVPSTLTIGALKLNQQINLTSRTSTLTIGTLEVRPAQSITLSGVPSTVTVGTLTLKQQVNLTGRASTVTIGSLTLKQQINLTGVPSTATIGAPTLKQQINLSGVPTTVSIGTLTVLAQQFIVLTGVSSTATIGTLTANQQIRLVSVTSTVSVGTLTVLAPQSVPLTGIASTLTIGTLKVNQSVVLTGRPSTLTIGTLTILVPQTTTLTGIASTLTIGALKVNQSIAPPSIGSTATVGTLKLQHSVALTGVPSSLTFGILAVQARINLVGVPSTVSIGSLKLNQKITLTGRVSTLTIGTLSVLTVQFIEVPSVTSTLTIGSPRVNESIALTGAASTATVGTLTLTQRITLGVPTVAVLGTPLRLI